jgi:hypothetical protein
VKKWTISLLMAVVASGLALAPATCGDDDDDGCPGIVCSDCGLSGDCNVSCEAGEEEYCGHFGYFEDPDLRCAFCEELGFEP